MIKKLQLVALGALLSAGNLFAQTADYKWSLGVNLGFSEYYGDLGNGFLKFDLSTQRLLKANGMGIEEKSPGYLGVSASRYLDRYFDANLAVNYGNWGHFTNTANAFYSRFISADVTARFKFLGKDNARFTPYILLGVGTRSHKINTPNDFGKERMTELTVPAGVGLNIKMEDRVYLNIQSHYGWTNNDQIEGSFKHQRYTWDQYWNHSIGLNFLIGKMKDADGDGVGDNRDKCPNTPKGALVDKTGCIVDGDKDGIADNLDKCPTLAGLEQFAGCPDSDKDGVQDSEDKCPEVAGLAKFNGCPDSDNDGIQDSEDKCPKVAGLSKFEGCPDTDGDGIEDAKDECPKKAGLPQFNGCADTDGDGIQDNKDKCPKVAGPASNNGCPEIKAAVKKVFEQALQGVQFETGKTTLKPSSNVILDKVVKIMKDNPEYKLFIAGHTDNVGKAESNLTLSKGRAASVLAYLVAKGIDPNRVKSEGFGDTQPVADTSTTAGKAKNRRVEFKVEFEAYSE